MQALEKGYRIVGLARHGVPAELIRAGVLAAGALMDLGRSLRRPRVVLLYVPGKWSISLTYAVFIVFILVMPTCLFRTRVTRAS